MKITEDTIQYVAALAKLDLNDQEKERAKGDLEKLINYVDIMNDLDTEDTVPMSHVLSLSNVFREDEVLNEPKRDQLLSNAPEKKEGYFKVPKTLE